MCLIVNNDVVSDRDEFLIADLDALDLGVAVQCKLPKLLDELLALGLVSLLQFNRFLIRSVRLLMQQIHEPFVLLGMLLLSTDALIGSLRLEVQI